MLFRNIVPSEHVVGHYAYTIAHYWIELHVYVANSGGYQYVNVIRHFVYQVGCRPVL